MEMEERDEAKEDISYHFQKCGRQMGLFDKTKCLPYFASSQTYHCSPEEIRKCHCQSRNERLKE